MKDRESKINRIVEAPIDLIWKCWTTPEHLPSDGIL